MGRVTSAEKNCHQPSNVRTYANPVFGRGVHKTYSRSKQIQTSFKPNSTIPLYLWWISGFLSPRIGFSEHQQEPGKTLFCFLVSRAKLCKNNSKHCFRRLHWTFGLDQYQKKIHHGLLTVSCVTSVKKYQHATRQKKLLSKHSCKSILTPNKNIPKNIQKRLVSSHFLP